MSKNDVLNFVLPELDFYVYIKFEGYSVLQDSSTIFVFPKSSPSGQRDPAIDTNSSEISSIILLG